MKTMITLQELAGVDLRPYKEVWLTSTQAVADSGHKEDERCLWRAEEAFTHDMMSEGTHDQNLHAVSLVVDEIADPVRLQDIEQAVQKRLAELGLEGEFYPAQVGNGPVLAD